MPKFIVFAWYKDEVLGGWNDCIGTTTTIEKAKNLVRYAEHFQIVELSSLKVIEEK